MQALPFPNNIQIETTSSCNAKCGFCPYPETSQTQPQGQMDDALFESLVDQISRHPVDLIQPFQNNDPLMDKKIVPRLELLIRKNPGSRIMITTNGYLLRPELARTLAAIGLHTIHISSNGLTSSVYRQTMGIDGYTVIKNINYLWDQIRKAGSPTKLVVTSVLMKANKSEIEHMRRYWRSRGVMFYVNPLNNRAGNLTEERFIQLLPFDEQANRDQLMQLNMSGCPSIYSFMGILWNGDVVRCCQDWRRARVMGNAREQSLESIWHGDHYRWMRAMSDAGRLNEVELCHECGEQQFHIDLGALNNFLARQPQSETTAADMRVAAQLASLRETEPEALQLSLLR